MFVCIWHVYGMCMCISSVPMSCVSVCMWYVHFIYVCGSGVLMSCVFVYVVLMLCIFVHTCYVYDMCVCMSIAVYAMCIRAYMVCQVCLCIWYVFQLLKLMTNF